MLLIGGCSPREDSYPVLFWNVENFFDTVDDPATADDEFLPDSYMGWNERVYRYKLEQLSRIIRKQNPVLLGLVEIENRQVLEDLRRMFSNPERWDIVHREGPDRRGIDPALLFRQDRLVCENISFYRPRLPSGGITREFLMAEFSLKGGRGEPFLCVVLHFPSKRGGESRSHPDRLACSRQLITHLQMHYQGRKILIMGDLNAGRDEEPVKMLKNFYIPLLTGENHWTYVYRGRKEQLDHLLVSREFLHGKPAIRPGSARTLRPSAMQDEFAFPEPFIKNRRIYGGVSDHYPIELRVESGE